MLELRDYQRDAIDGVYNWFEESAGNPLVVVPTGGGKSVIAAEMIREIIEALPKERLLVVTHVKELIAQNHAALCKFAPELQLKTGIYSAGLRRRDTRSQILFGGVQSIYNKTEMLGHFDLILIDEAHLVSPKGFGMYRQLLSGLRAINPLVKLIGLTATPFRTDTGKLDEGGDERLFHGIAYECSIPQMIKDGWLSPMTNRGTASAIDTSQVGIRAGEFKLDELEKAATIDGLVVRAVDELLSRAQDRKAWLIFTCGVEHAKQVHTELESRGVSATSVYGHTKHGERDERIEAFKRGEVQAMVNVNVLTTGFDAPHIDLIALMRPTESPGLYVQMVGRGLRIAPGKKDCLVLDYGTNVLRHGPLDKVRPKQPGEGDGEPSVKECPECHTICMAGTVICPGPDPDAGEVCGYVFPKETQHRLDHDEKPDEETDLLSGADRIQEWRVQKVYYSRNCGRERDDGTKKHDTVRVEYVCGMRRYVNEFICFDHPAGNYARRKANGWWHEHLGKQPPPEDVSEALARLALKEIPPPSFVIVDVSGEYAEVKGIKYEDDEKWRGDAAEQAVHLDMTQEELPF